MKKAYLYLLIGTILMFFSLGIIALDLIIHIAGYGLMILGMLLILQQRESPSLLIASQLTIGLLIFELLKVGVARAIMSNTLLSIGFMTLILVTQLSIFYLIIKSEGDASESLEVQTYQQAELLLSIGLLGYILFLISARLPFPYLQFLICVSIFLLCMFFISLSTHIVINKNT